MGFSNCFEVAGQFFQLRFFLFNSSLRAFFLSVVCAVELYLVINVMSLSLSNHPFRSSFLISLFFGFFIFIFIHSSYFGFPADAAFTTTATFGFTHSSYNIAFRSICYFGFIFCLLDFFAFLQNFTTFSVYLLL